MPTRSPCHANARNGPSRAFAKLHGITAIPHIRGRAGKTFTAVSVPVFLLVVGGVFIVVLSAV